MKRFLLGLISSFSLVSFSYAESVSCNSLGQVKEIISKRFTNLKVDAINKSEIPCLYEVVAGDNIVYTDGNYFVFGHIVDFTGRDITGEKLQSLLSKKVKELDLSKAIKIGNGKVEVIEFTDPECPFCRRAEDMLSSVSGDITRYVFLMPLPFHKKAEPLACLILSSKDKEATYRDVMAGKYDNSSNLKCDDKVKSLLSEHKEISMKMGIQGTPTFFVKTKSGEYIRVNGADPNLVNIIKDQLK